MLYSNAIALLIQLVDVYRNDFDGDLWDEVSQHPYQEAYMDQCVTGLTVHNWSLVSDNWL